jgi:putative transposase
VGTEKPSYKGFRFPPEIISHCVWLYHRFPLSLREVEEMMLQRGVTVSHESIREWCATFGQTYANGLRRRRARPGDKWHLDEVFSQSTARPTTCGGRSISTGPCWTSWSPPAATPSPRPGSSVTCSRAWSTCRGCWSPTAGQLPSGAAQGCPLGRAPPVEVSNNRAENSHQPTRQRERAMKRFTSPGSRKELTRRLCWFRWVVWGCYGVEKGGGRCV